MHIQAQRKQWPRRPYRGLDYYHERHAPLFRERDREAQECAQLLVGFGLKILLLHGSSGSGKSSFLRAGLIPALKQTRQRSCFFLAGQSGVIRASSDPLPAIADALIAALRNSAVFVSDEAPAADPDGADDPLHIGEETRRRLTGALQAALPGDRRHLGSALIQALAEICADLPGRLILVLDQAEEVLTRSADGLAESQAAAFFRFMEDVYIRNIDLRLVVTLRTEYYGRFRDELRISDDRLAERPAKGGIQQFLLRSLRDPDTLVRIIDAPTAARRTDGSAVYGFTFQDADPESRDITTHVSLKRRIVDDLLAEFPASVTPALQVICASLYQQLPEGHGEITHALYRKSGGARRMIMRYIRAGIAVAGATRPAEVEKWQTLLHSLVSRQGGGTVVSLSESPAELARRASQFGIAGDIPARLAALTKGDAPLLRAEPCDAPLSYGLKHDILAVVLARWHDVHGGAVDARARERIVRRLVVAGCAIACALVVAVGVTMVASRSLALAQAEADNISLKNAYAERSPTGNYRLSLLLLLANLQITEQPRGWIGNLFANPTAIHAETETALRHFLPRAPWFAGEYRAAGLDPDGSRLAALLGDTVSVIDLPNGVEERRDPAPHQYALRPTTALQGFGFWPSVGFVTGLGPAAYINGNVQFWPNDGPAEIRSLGLPPLRGSQGPARVEFIGGRLQIAWKSPGASAPRSLLRLDADDLRKPDGWLAEKVKAAVDKISEVDAPRAPMGFRPMPVYSESSGQPQRSGSLAPLLGGTPGLVLIYDDPRNSTSTQFPIDTVPRLNGLFDRLDTTLAFAANADALAYKADGRELVVLALTTPATPLRIAISAGNSPREAAAQDGETWRLGQASLPFAYPPLAVVRIAQHWRAAGLGTKGVWVVESSDEAPDRAALLLGGELPSGEDRSGLKLQFSRDGGYLLLTQQRQFNTPATIRIWNLDTAWRDWIDPPERTDGAPRGGANITVLRQTACRIILADGLGAFDAAQGELFQIAEPFRQPCPDQHAARN